MFVITKLIFWVLLTSIQVENLFLLAYLPLAAVVYLIFNECEGVSSNPTMLGEQMKKWPRKAKPYSSKKIMA